MNSADVNKVSNEIYASLTAQGLDVLFDDRENMSPGFKFKDADLLGMPHHIIVGDKGLKLGQLEFKNRRSGERTMVKLDEVSSEVQKLLSGK
jgi:prolyl-tRNA synthetase